ncbi:hypothetical protein [Actinoplanes sp. NPDC051859]|uniref:hypothetical protein n=1 Tax=Actinoplanes sp. NPDC051859 TaxID=3363909 RepID=UPI0037A2F820
METEALTVDAFAQLGIDARTPHDDADADLIIETAGLCLTLQLKRRALVSAGDAEQVLRDSGLPTSAVLIVADRVTQAARKILSVPGVGYYDLRGRLALRADGMVIDAEVQPLRKRPQRMRPLSGKAGLEIACAVLLRPEQGTAVRELARQVGRSASTVSEVLAAFRSAGLVNADNSVPDSRLFWDVAENWATPGTYLLQLPVLDDAPSTQTLRLGHTDVTAPGWALTDSAAAAAYGAPVAFRSGQVLDFYVPDRTVQHRATTLLGTPEKPALARATVRIAPVPAVVQERVDLTTNPMEWPLAHPLFVALDLAQDPGRGREILDAWTPDGRWTRVW